MAVIYGEMKENITLQNSDKVKPKIRKSDVLVAMISPHWGGEGEQKVYCLDLSASVGLRCVDILC